MSDWHIRKIPKGIYGELSKITEELEEALDSEERGQTLMLMFELSDIIGAAGGVAAKYGMKLLELLERPIPYLIRELLLQEFLYRLLRV